MNKASRIVASIEARMGSSRLPGKVLSDINGQTALGRLVSRLRNARLINDVVIATTTLDEDDVLAEWCKDNDVSCFRGSQDNVLNRVVEAHKEMESDVIVEITGDCPMTDPDIVDLGVETFLNHDVDVVTNCGNLLTWPMGQYVQVFPLRLLEEVDRNINDSAVHEHVSLYFYEHPERYKIIDIVAPKRWRYPTFRFQLDYPEDLEFQRRVHSLLEPKFGPYFDTEEILALLRTDPSLLEINIHCEEKSVR